MSINFNKYEKTIWAKVRAQRNWVPSMDYEDVAQELRLQLWLKKDKFQPEKRASEKTFVNRILDNKIKDLQRTVNRKKRQIDTYHFTFSQLDTSEAGQAWLDTAQPILI